MIQLLVALALTALTVIAHTFYTLHLLNIVHRRKYSSQNIKIKTRQWLRILVSNVVILLLVHCAETAIWATFYFYRSAFQDFSTSLYFSIVSYSTIGYGDVTLPSSLRLVGAIEGLVGTLMAGWSVALLVGLLQAALRSNAQIDARHSASDHPTENVHTQK